MDPVTLGLISAGGSLLSMLGGPKEVPGANLIPDFIRKRTQMGDAMAADIGKAKINAQALMNQRARNLQDQAARVAAQGATNLMGALGSGAENVVGSQQALANYNQTQGMSDQWKLAADMNAQMSALEQWNAQQQNALKTDALNSEMQMLPMQMQVMQQNAPTTTAGAIGSLLSNAAGGIGSFLNLSPTGASPSAPDMSGFAGLINSPWKPGVKKAMG